MVGDTVVKTLAYSFGCTIVIVNIVFIIFGIKTFSKKTHSILVLGLGIADGFHGVSVLGFANDLVGGDQEKNATHDNVPDLLTHSLCYIQVILYYASIGLSLTVLLFISVERFITVKNFNFAKGTLTMQRKCIIIACTVAFNLTYIFTWILTTPIDLVNGKRCTIRALYTAPVHQMHGLALVILYLAMIGANIGLYGRTTWILWKTFRKASIHSVKRKANSTGSVKTRIRSVQLSPMSSIGPIDLPNLESKNPIILAPSGCEDRPHVSVGSKDPIHNPTIIGERKRSLWKLARERVMQSRVSFRPSVHPENPYTSHMSIEINIEQTIKPEPKRRMMTEKAQSFRKRQRKASTVGFNPWERRAMITNCYLIIDHIVFLMPFIGVLVADLLQADIPVVVWRFAVFWMMLHFLINPFIFAWRVKEVHTEMRRMFRCSTQVAPDFRKFSFKGRSFSLK